MPGGKQPQIEVYKKKMEEEKQERAQSIRFKDDIRREILLCLAVAANHCYDFVDSDTELYEKSEETEIYEGSELKVGDVLTLKQMQRQDKNASKNIQYGYYEINNKIAGLGGKRILAFRGTYSLLDIKEDVAIVFKGKLPITNKRNIADIASDQAIEVTKELASKHGVDFICGHSLGGGIAEVVCSELGIRGASFNAPGMYSPKKTASLLRAKEHNNVEFECHLTSWDPVSNVGSREDFQLGKLGASHIGPAFWHDKTTHKMGAMLKTMHKLYNNKSPRIYGPLLTEEEQKAQIQENASTGRENINPLHTYITNPLFSEAKAQKSAQERVVRAKEERKAQGTKVTMKDNGWNNPIYDETKVKRVGDMNVNQGYNGGADHQNQLHDGRNKKKKKDGQLQSIKLNESGGDNSMTAEKYERMLGNRESVKEKFRDYIINEDGYNNLGQPGYKLREVL